MRYDKIRYFCSMRVDVDLKDEALQIVLDEQAKYAKKGKTRGKERIILLLLTELYHLRIKDSIAPPAPMSKKEWKKFITKKTPGK